MGRSDLSNQRLWGSLEACNVGILRTVRRAGVRMTRYNCKIPKILKEDLAPNKNCYNEQERFTSELVTCLVDTS